MPNFDFSVAMFQSTHLREVRLTYCYEHYFDSGFNPRTCGRCDYYYLSFCLIWLCFNPRTCGRCDMNKITLTHSQLSFNPRTCGRCDWKTGACMWGYNVSIHAPAGGATKRIEEWKAPEDVSIHAPAGGATKYM